VHNLGHACLENILGLLRLFEGKGDNVATLRGHVYRILVEVDAVDEGRRAKLDLMLFKKLLQVDLTHHLPALDIPVHEFRVIPRRQA
jgi:hypothetical protein